MNSRKYILSNYPLQLQKNFIDLYKVEIINRLDQNSNLWKEFNCINGDAIIEEYLSAHIDAESREIKHKITQKLYDALIESNHKDLLYPQIMEFMEIVDKELYQSLCIDKWKNETFSSTFQKFLIVLHKIRPVFDIKNVVCNLKQYSSELGKHYQPVIERWEKKNIDDEYTKSLIIRIVHFVHAGDNIANAIEDIMTNGNESKHAYNLFFGSISPYHLRPLMYENSA
uniref:Uncharacterized protein n=1 Tax=Panagrolaimus sp. PS1159 TaxID=55785 RepID=A0AC35F4K5_9BILA